MFFIYWRALLEWHPACEKLCTLFQNKWENKNKGESAEPIWREIGH